MIQRTRKHDGNVSSRACLIAVLIALLIFPPWMFGDQVGWTGSAGAYTDNTWNCSSNCNPGDLQGYPFNYNNGSSNIGFDASIQSGGPFDSTVTLNNIEQGIDAVTLDSMSIRGVSAANDTPATNATLNVQGLTGSGLPNLTLGTPGATQGSVLYVGNNGNLNLAQGATVALELSGGGGSLNPGAANSVDALIDSGGTVNIADNSTLMAQNSFGGTRVITNNGVMNVGQGNPSGNILFANANPGLSSTFVLGGNGVINMGGVASGGEFQFSGASITGMTGTENLVIGSGQTIQGSGFIGQQPFWRPLPSTFASVTNNGTLSATAAGGNFPLLVVTAPLTNYDAPTGTMTNGSYNALGAELYLTNVGSIQSLNLANVQLQGAGGPLGPGDAIIAAGANNGSNGGNFDAIATLSRVTDGTVDLQGSLQTITPSTGTLTLRSDPLGLPTNLTVEQDSNGNSSFVTIAGNLNNESKTYGAYEPTTNQKFGAVNGNPGTTVFDTGGSSINVSGSNLLVIGNLNNRSNGTPDGNGLFNYQYALSNINVMNGGSMTVGGDLITQTNSNGNSFISLNGYDDANNAVGASLTVNGNLRNGGSFGNPLSQGFDIMELSNGSLTVGQNFTNNNAGGFSYVSLSNSTATVGGWFGQFQGGSATGASELDLENGSAMTVANLRNSTGAFNANTLDFQPQSGIQIQGGSSLTITGNFANLSNGVLSGGSYYLGGPNGSTASVLNYNGPADTGITTIDVNTAVTLDDGNGGITGQIRNTSNNGGLGGDALSPYLTTVNGSLTLANNATLNLTSAQGLTIGSTGQVTVGSPYTSTTLTANSLTNNGVLNIGDWSGNVTVGFLGNLIGNVQAPNVNPTGVLTGGTWNLSGFLFYDLGADGALGISGLSGATVSLAPSGRFANGTSSGSYDGFAYLNSIANGSTLTLYNPQSENFQGLNIDASTVNLYNGVSSTFGVSGGNGLSLTTGATLNVGQQGDQNNSTATLDLRNGASVEGSSDGQPPHGPSAINVNDNGILALTNGDTQSPTTATGTLTLNGNLNINGNSSAGVLSVSDGKFYAINGSGSVSLNGLGQINVSNGNLAINAGLSNWSYDPGGGLTELVGGTYIVGNGATLQLSAIGAGQSIGELNAATVSVTGNGLLTGDGTTNALSGLTAIDSLGSLTLHNAGNVAITPGNTPGGANTFVLSNNLDAGGAAEPTLNLRDGTNLQLNGSFQSFGGNLNITNGSSLTVGYTQPLASHGSLSTGNSITGVYVGSFDPIDSNGRLGTDGSTPINLLIGSGSSLIYSGAEITSIDGSSSLTLGNREGNGTGTIQNLNGGKHDALSDSLNAVDGTFNLQNGAVFTLGASAGSFTNNGFIGVTNDSTLDVSAVGNNFTSGPGGYLVGGGSKLIYSGADITTLSGALTLDNSNGDGTGQILNLNGGSHDALSATLTSLGGGTLTLQNGASLVLTGAQSSFQTYGERLSATNGSTFDVSALGSNFLDVDNSGNFSDPYLIGSGSSLIYNGADITAINGNLILDNSNGSGTGSIQNMNGGQHDALSNTLTAINDNLKLQNGASLTLSQAVTVSQGTINVDQTGNGGSTLTLNGKLTNYNGNVYVGTSQNYSTLSANAGLANKSDDNNSDFYGNAELSLQNSYAPVNGNLFNGAFTQNGGYANAQIDIASNSDTEVGGDLKNLALFGASGNSSNAVLNIDNSYLSVGGNVKNVAAQGQFDSNVGAPTSLASINLTTASEMDVTGTFKNYSGGGGYFGGSQATLNLNDASSMSVGGLLTNSGGSVISLDNDYNGGSFLDAQGGFNNYNSSTFLNFNSQMQVAAGFQNLSDDSANSAGSGYACLAVGTSSCSSKFIGNAQGSNVQGASQSNASPFPSEATITGGLVNSAATSNGGAATSAIMVASGSFLNVDNLTNSAMAATPGGFDSANANLTLGQRFDLGGTLNVTGDLNNTASVPLFLNGSSNGNAWARITSNGGSLNVGGSVTNSAAVNANGGAVAEIDLYYGSTATVKGSFTNTSGALYMDGGSTATIAGLFTNDSNSIVSLQNSQVISPVQGTSQGTTTNSTGIVGGATTLNVTGEFDNAGTVAIGTNTALTVVEDGNGHSAYNQTGGITTLDAGGTLQADNVNITGGTVQGVGGAPGGTQLVATIAGNLNLGGDPTQTEQTATLDLVEPVDPMAVDVFGNYDQTTLGILDLSLAGVGDNGTFTGSLDDNNNYDQVNVTGNILALDGTLNLNLEAGFLSSVVQGDYFNILNWSGVNDTTGACVGSASIGCFGTFNDLTFTDSLGNLDTFSEQINPGDGGTELDLVVVGVSATPEPGTLSMLFCAMLIGGGVTWYRRKRKNTA